MKRKLYVGIVILGALIVLSKIPIIAATLVNLTNQVTGTLPHGNGGTDVTSPGANGNVLTSNGTNWTSAAAGACATCTLTIANGTVALGTTAVGSGACSTAATATATGAASTDNVAADFNADPTSTTGYQAGAMLTIVKWVTTNQVNFKQCNNTGSSITPSAVTLNWRVTR